MKISAKEFSMLPMCFQELFVMLPNPGSEEVLACFPERAASCIGDRAGGCEFFMKGDKRESAMGGFDDSGSAARFFASFPQEDECAIIHEQLEEVKIEWISESGPCQALLLVDMERSPEKVIVES